MAKKTKTKRPLSKKKKALVLANTDIIGEPAPPQEETDPEFEQWQSEVEDKKREVLHALQTAVREKIPVPPHEDGESRWVWKNGNLGKLSLSMFRFKFTVVYDDHVEMGTSHGCSMATRYVQTDDVEAAIMAVNLFLPRLMGNVVLEAQPKPRVLESNVVVFTKEESP